MSMPDPAPQACSRAWLCSLPGVLLLVAAYALVHSLARLGASGNLGEDDPLDNLLIQSLQAGYSPTQPPLYDWLLWALQQGLGTGVEAFLLLKYTALVALAGVLFLITRRLTGSGWWGLLAVDAMALTYQLFWRYHEGFTHRAGAIALAAASAWALLRYLDRGHRQDAWLVGLLAGLGLLSEPGYAILLVALLVAALLQRVARARLLPALLPITVIALAVTSPYLAWLSEEPGRWQTWLAAIFPVPATRSVADTLNALGDNLRFPLLVLSPYIFLLPLFFPGVWTALRRQRLRPALSAAGFDARLWLLHALLLELAWLVLVDGLWFQAHDYPVHRLLPLFIIAIPWLTALLQDARPSVRRLQWFVGFSLLMTVVALLGRLGNMYVHEPVCSKCRWGTPYASLAGQMRSMGFSTGSVVAVEIELAGNLRRFFPDARFVVPPAGLMPPQVGNHADTIVVWSGGDGIPARLLPALPEGFPENARYQALKVPWTHLWKPTGYRTSEWNLAWLPAHPVTPAHPEKQRD